MLEAEVVAIIFDIIKWTILIVVWLVGSIFQKFMYAEVWKDEVKNDNFHWKSILNIEKLGPYLITRALIAHVDVFLATLFFPVDYDFWPIKMAWLARDTSFLSWTDWAIILGGGAAIAITVRVVDSSISVWRATAAILVEQLLSVVIFIGIGLLYGSLVYVSCSVIYLVAWQSPEWTPGWVVFWFRLGSILGVVSLPLFVYYTLGLVAKPLRLPLDAVRVITHVLDPYLRRSKYPHVADFNPASKFPAVDTGPPDSEVSLLVFSDTHFPKPGLNAIGSSRSPEETVNFIEECLDRDGGSSTILHCGDVTDRGDPEAWEIAKRLFSDRKVQVMTTCGNHDVHFKRIAAGRLFVPASYDFAELTKNLSMITGHVDAETYRPTVRRVANRNVVVVAFDSNLRPTSTPITNALGKVGEHQVSLAQQALRQMCKSDDVLLVMLHHHVLVPPFSVDGAYLRCLDAARVIRFAVDNKAAAIIHGHKHMPYVCEYRDRLTGHELLVISCGSSHHDAEGPLKAEVVSPSCYRLSIGRNGIEEVRLIKNLKADLNAPPIQASSK